MQTELCVCAQHDSLILYFIRKSSQNTKRNFFLKKSKGKLPLLFRIPFHEKWDHPLHLVIITWQFAACKLRLTMTQHSLTRFQTIKQTSVGPLGKGTWRQLNEKIHVTLMLVCKILKLPDGSMSALILAATLDKSGMTTIAWHHKALDPATGYHVHLFWRRVRQKMLSWLPATDITSFIFPACVGPPQLTHCSK